MNRSVMSSRIDVEGASNGTDAVVSQAISRVSDGALSSPGGGSNGGPCPAFLKFLECDVAVDQLMQFLKLEEMKFLCLVSKDVLAVVMRTREFAKRSRFAIKRKLVKKLAASEVDLHTRFPFSWKNMSFDVSLPMEVVNQFADKLKSVESLQLYYKSRDYSQREEPNMSSAAKYCVRIHAILSMTNKLRELQLDQLLLDYPLNETFSNLGVQESLSKLESLIVDDSDTSRRNSPQFKKNLLEFSRCPFSKIKKFSMEYFIDKPKELDCFVEVIKAFKETLEELNLNQNIWQLEEMTGMRCPKLRQLTVGMSETDLEGVAAFAENQPLLEELYLDIHTGEPDKNLKCFSGCLPNVRKFRYYFEQGFVGELEEVDWKFLETMTKLEEIYIRLPFDGRGPEMIDRLPDSVKKLDLEGHKDDRIFWCNSSLDSSSNIGNHLKRLRNLTHLRLSGCFDAVSDAGLQTIIKTLPNLMELRLGKCTELTDFGISGVNGNEGVQQLEPGVPLSDLKRLVELEVSHCDLITTTCILTVVRFESLRSFKFCTSAKNAMEETDHFASQIREHNPRLTLLKHNRHNWIKNGLVWTHKEEEEGHYHYQDMSAFVERMIASGV